jgi:hypothetical protein
MKNYCDPHLIFDYNDKKKEAYAKDVKYFWFLNHTIKDLTDQSLESWKEDRELLVSTPNKFHSYAQYFHIHAQDFASCTIDEKMMILWRFIGKHTYSTGIWVSRTKGFVSAFGWQDVNHYKKEKNVDPRLKNYTTCMGLALIYKTLAKEFLWMDGEIKSVLYHSYFKSSTGECVDYSAAAIKWRKNGFFATEEEYLERTATWQPKKKSIVDKTRDSIYSIFPS